MLNYLSKRDIAIVSEIAGTTRDVIEAHLNLDGYPVIISDTAGIRSSKDEIEKKGIKLALKKGKVFGSDQIALNMTVYVDKLPLEILPAYCNWIFINDMKYDVLNNFN